MLLVDNEFNRSMGLGNKLFSWARAYCATQLLAATQIEPKWFAIRNAAFLRGGIDYRYLFGKVFLYNNFKSDPAAISKFFAEMQSRLGLIQSQKCYFSDLMSLKSHKFSGREWIIFRADQAHNFLDLADYQRAIKQKLEQLSNLPVDWQPPVEPFIAINYRSGNDFTAHSTGGSQSKTDLNWFIYAVKWARKSYGNLPVHVISDGAPHHLVDLVKGVGGCQIHQFGTAIEDLQFLSKANVLLASGNSSFSAWAAFLSGADAYSSKATPLDRWRINASNPNQTIGIIE